MATKTMLAAISGSATEAGTRMTFQGRQRQRDRVG